MAVEKGKVGLAVRNTNGTYDLGPMQVNTLWLKEIESFGITREQLKNNGCINVQVGIWILHKHDVALRKKTGNDFLVEGSVEWSDHWWKVMQNYHSKTAKHAERYKALLMKIDSRVYWPDLINYANKDI
jgi:hypothetical protein